MNAGAAARTVRGHPDGTRAERLAKLIAKTQADLAKTQAKLANESFVRNAPPQVVSGERERAAELTRAAADLGTQLERLRGASAS